MATNPFETSNPFAVTAPGTPSSATVTPTGYNATGYQANGYNATGYDAATATSTGYDAAQADTERAAATMRTVQDNELVQRQLSQIIGDDSPLLQRARSKALEQMNARGLVNSSMALGAADAAMYDYAMPIAQADASTYGTAARDNQQYTNSAAQFNAGEANRAAQVNAGFTNDASRFTASEANQTSRTNAGLVNEASRFNAGATNDASRFTADSANESARFNAGQSNDASRFNADAANDTSKFNASETNRAILQTNDQQFRAALANSDAQVRAALTVLDNELAQARQDSAAASEITRQFQSSATQIMTSDLPAESKQQMINQLINMTRQSLAATQGIDSLPEIDAILTLEDLPDPNATEPAADEPAAASETLVPGVQPTVPSWQYVNDMNRA